MANTAAPQSKQKSKSHANYAASPSIVRNPELNPALIEALKTFNKLSISTIESKLGKGLVSLDKSLVTLIIGASTKLNRIASAVNAPPTNPILAMAHEQSEKFKTELIKSGKVVTATQLGDALGLTRQALNKAVREHRMFSLSHGRNVYYPVFFADTSMNRKELEKVCRVLGAIGGAEKYQFFARPKNSLGGRTPVQALKDGDLQKVLQTAEGFISR